MDMNKYVFVMKLKGYHVFDGDFEDEQDVLDEGSPDFFKKSQIIRRRIGDIIIDYNFTYMNDMSIIGDAYAYAMQEMRMGKSGTDAIISGLVSLVFHDILDEQILAGVISDIQNNQVAGTKRDIVSESDSGPEKFRKVFEYAFDRLSPSSVIGVKEALKEGQPFFWNFFLPQFSFPFLPQVWLLLLIKHFFHLCCSSVPDSLWPVSATGPLYPLNLLEPV